MCMCARAVCVYVLCLSVYACVVSVCKCVKYGDADSVRGRCPRPPVIALVGGGYMPIDGAQHPLDARAAHRQP